LLIHAPDEHWNRNCQTLPSPPISTRCCRSHGHGPPVRLQNVAPFGPNLPCMSAFLKPTSPQ
jgi:hypothetical protein